MEEINNIENKQLVVTSIEELKQYANGELVPLPGFVEDKKFVARLKRPSLLSMVKNGTIPNELLEEANKLFVTGPKGVVNQPGVVKNIDKDTMKSLFDLLELICEEAFIEPKYSELKANGIELTDSQYLAIFSYSQQGVESLKSFR